MYTNKVIVFLVIIGSVVCLSVKELDEIFGDVECIEGEFMLQNVEDVSGIRSPTNVVLVKTQGIDLASKQDEETTSLLTEIKKTIQDDKNALNKINELAQFNKIEIEFILIGETGDAHDKTYRVRLNLGDEVYQASGRKIKDAKRKAAAVALSNTKYLHPPAKTSEEIEGNVQQLTPTVHLNNIAGKLGMKVEYFNEGTENLFIDYSDKYLYYSLDSSKRGYSKKFNETLNLEMKSPSVENSGNSGPFRVRVDVGDENFVGTGWTIQSARHDAAEQALEKFRRMSLQDADACVASGQLCNKLNVKSPISALHETAAKHQWQLAFDVISETGPAHKRLFLTRCTLHDLTTEAEGNSKKEAKRKAAEAMLQLLGDVQPWDLINVRNENSSKKKRKNKKNKNKITRPGAIEQAAMNVLDAFSALPMEPETPVGESRKSESKEAMTKGPRSELLELGQEIGINVRFSSYQDDQDWNQERYGSLVSLDTDPGYHCYAVEKSSQEAQDNAALSALKFLKHVGLNNILIPLGDHNGKKVIIFDEGTTGFQQVKTDQSDPKQS